MSKSDNLADGAGVWLAVTGIGLTVIVCWEIASRVSLRVEFLLSRPTQIAGVLIQMVRREGLVLDIGVTAYEALLGIVLGTVVGSFVGLALWLSPRMSRTAAPFILIAANFPVFALAPAAIVWLGIGLGLKVFLAAFSTCFVSLSLAYRGAMAASRDYNGVFDGFTASRWDNYRKVIVPGALESVLSSMRVNVGLGILGAFIGEFIASNQGLGRVIIRASGLYQIDRVFAASACIIGLAYLFDRMARGIEAEKLVLARAFGVPGLLRTRTQALFLAEWALATAEAAQPPVTRRS